VKERRLAYLRIWRQRPDVKERIRAYSQRRRLAYRQRPEVKERERARHQRPEVKEQNRAYRQRPEVKKRSRGRRRRGTRPARSAKSASPRRWQVMTEAAGIVLLNLVLPSGKMLKDSTGAECGMIVISQSTVCSLRLKKRKGDSNPKGTGCRQTTQSTPAR
jgi:hypothetical protein